MTEEQRQHRRIDKMLNTQFCLADVYPPKWDMLVIENISAGGLRFKAPSDLNLEGKKIYLQVKIPELAPHLLQVEAVVLSVTPRHNAKISDVRVKFVNLTDENKAHLAIVEKIINAQEARNARKDSSKGGS